MKSKFLNSIFLMILLSVLFTAASISFVFSVDLEALLSKVLPITLTILVILTGFYLGLLKYFQKISANLLRLEDEKKQNYSEKVNSSPDVEKRDMLRREMFSNISHEMKTPLTTIRGYAEMMENQMIPEEDIPLIAAKMSEESSHLLGLIERVMDSMRHPEELPILEQAMIDMKKTVSDVAERLLPLAKQKRISLLTEGESVILCCDRDLLEQICYNLIDNAIKYTKEGGTVRVTVDETALGKRIVVADNGIGISQEDQKRIFERFFRVDRSHCRNVDGTGLGLSIVKHHADMLGAELILNSNFRKRYGN